MRRANLPLFWAKPVYADSNKGHAGPPAGA